MSNVKLSTPGSKQLNLALHSRQFQSYPSTLLQQCSVHGGPACSEPLRERPFRFSCQGRIGGCRRCSALGPEPACQRALHGLPQVQARGMVQQYSKTSSKQPVWTGQRQQQGTRRRQQRQTLPLVESTAVGLYWISTAYQPKFDVWGAQERAPDRDSTVPGLYNTVFGSRPSARLQ
jgi:hypothetical protein